MKPRPRLQDMPCLVKERITSHLDLYTDKMSLCAAFPNYRPIIGDPEFECDRFVLAYRHKGQIILTFRQDPEHHRRNYAQKENGCQVSIVKKGSEDVTREIFVEGGNFIDLAARDFEMFVDNPNFVIEKFVVAVLPWFRTRNYSTIEAFTLLSRIQAILMKGKLKAKEFVMKYKEDQADVLKILPYLDSDVLDSLELEKTCSAQNYELDEIVQLEQFKKLKKLKMFDTPKLPFESWWDIPSTEMRLRHVKLEDFKKILEHFREAPCFQKSVLKTEFSWFELRTALDCSSRYTTFPETEDKNGLRVIFGYYVDIERK